MQYILTETEYQELKFRHLIACRKLSGMIANCLVERKAVIDGKPRVVYTADPAAISKALDIFNQETTPA